MFQQTPQKRVLFSRGLTSVIATVFVALSIFSLLLTLRPAHAIAATSSTLNFQARLETAAGAIVPDGNYNVEFKLYTVASGGTSVWSETYRNSTTQGITVKNGYLTANLGSISAFPGTINWDQDLWVTLNIAGTSSGACGAPFTTPYGSNPCAPDGEMNPRLHLTAVPYAFKAGQLAQFNNANGFTSTLNLIQPTVGNQVFQIADQGAAGTYNVCVQSAITASGGCAPTTGGSGYIQNQSAAQQTTSNFWISGSGRADTALQAPSFDTPTAVALNIGTANATGINIGTNAAAHTIAVGTGAAVQGITIGSTNTTSSLTLQSGSGGVQINGAVTGSSTITGTTLNGTTGINTGAGAGTQRIDASGNLTNIGTIALSGTISGGTTYTANTALQAPLHDTATAVALAVGSTNATSITLGKTTGTTNIQTTIYGTALFKPNSDTTSAFQIQNAGGSSVFTADTQNTRVGIGSNIPLNTFSVSPIDITGTASGTTAGVVTATVGTFTSGMVGEQLVFANGVSGTITTFTSGTQVTISPSPASAVSSQSFSVYKIGLQVSSTGGVAAGVNAFNGKLTVGGEIALQESAAPAGTTGYGKVYTSSTDHKLHFVNNTGTDVAMGSGSASSLQDAYNTSATTSPQIILTTTNGGIKIADGSPALTGNLFSVTNNAASATYLGISASALTLQNTSGYSAMIFDSTSNHLKIYESVATPTRYADIYYSSANGGEAVYAASSGNTRVGSGSGNVSINLTNVPDVLNFTKTGTLSTVYTADDFTIRRNMTAGANNVQGNVLRIEDVSTASTGSLQSTVLYVNQNNLSATGNLIAAAQNGTNKFTVDTTGTATATTFSGTTGNITTVNGTNVYATTSFSGPTYTGSGAVTFSSGGTNTNVTLQSAGTGSVLLKPGTDSATAIKLANAAGTAILTVDSSTASAAGGKVVIGSSTTDTVTALLQLDSNSSYLNEPTCATATNQGGLYYNTASNAVRACVGGNWEDLPSTAGLGIFLFGVVPDSGSDPGDLPSLTNSGVSGPCKVSWASATSINIAPCTAYTGGRKLIVPATTLSSAGGTWPSLVSTTNIWAHLCLIGSGNQPAFTAAGSTETGNMSTLFSINNPILCLADVKFSATTSGNIAQIYDTRTFINSQKEFMTLSTAAGLGQVVCAATLHGGPCSATTAQILGVVVATTGGTSTTSPAAIITTMGPAYIKATAGTAANFITSTTTAGYVSTTATAAFTNAGDSRTTFSSTCTSAATCLGSLYTNFKGR